MKKIFYSALLLTTMAAQSQTFQWLETPAIELDLNPGMVGYSVANDPSGNVYFTGFKSQPYAYNDLMGNLYYNKYDSNGQLLFSKEIGGKACNHNLAADSQGNIIMELGYVGTITIDGLTISTVEQGDHFVLAKFNAQGNLLWHKLIISEEEFTWTSELRALHIDAQDNIYIGYDNYGTSYIDKYSPDGTKVQSIVQQHVNRVTSVSVDSDGNIYAAGACADNMATFAGVQMPSPFAYNTYVVKYSPQGVYQWMQYTENITCTSAQVVARTPYEIYYSSDLFGPYAFEGIAAEGPDGNGFEDFFLARLNAAGDYEWVREVPGEGKAIPGNRNFLRLDNDGNIYFTGQTGGNINWGNGIATETPLMGNQALVLKYSPDGVVLMAKTTGGNGYNRADGISADANGNIYIAGMANNTAFFDTLEHEAGPFDTYPYLAKISNTTTGTGDFDAKEKVIVYPNPAKDNIYLSGIDGKVQGNIINMLGQTVTAFETGVNSPIAVQQLPVGTYFIKAEGLQSVKFIKN
ncbi:T9SS type A sorting domain-containing protein [Flavobacterium album]|nr:T9SS type A sorting domain-containing protein [Flavobacterium album]